MNRILLLSLIVIFSNGAIKASQSDENSKNSNAKYSAEKTAELKTFLAKKDFNLDNIKTLLSAKADPNEGILFSCVHNQPAVVHLLLSHGANPHYSNALHRAISLGSNRVVAAMLLSRPNLEHRYKSLTLLMTACLCNNLDAIKLLLFFKADLKAQYTDGSTALHLTAAQETVHNDTIDLLLKHKADLEARNNDGYTPLSYAALHGSIDGVRTLLKKGANRNTYNKKGTHAAKVAFLRSFEFAPSLSRPCISPECAKYEKIGIMLHFGKLL